MNDGALSLHGSARVDDFTVSVDLDVAPGQTLAVVGPNGAGKSTVVRLLAGLVALESGRLELAGDVLDDAAANRFVEPAERRLGIVFQDRRLFPHLDVGENIAFGLRSRGVRRAGARDQAREVAGWLGIAESLDRRPNELSGGQQQRVAVARALVGRPRALLLDEPLIALDASSYRVVRSVLQERLRALGVPVVLVTHDPVEAMTLADRIVVLDGGTVVQTDTPDAIRRRPRSRWVADLLGVNLFHGTRQADHVVIDAEHTIVVASDASTSVADGPVDVVVHPRSVTVHRDEPVGSARNVWSAVVADVDSDGDRVRVLTRGPLPVVAEITEAARSALAIEPGAKVWISFKATEVAVHPG